MQGLSISKGSELLSSELGCESHVGFLINFYLGVRKANWGLSVEYKGK